MGLIKVLPVSGPSRGIGSFLLYRESITISKENLFPAPSQGIGGGPTNIEDIPMMPPAPMFPTSLEGWVVSYKKAIVFTGTVALGFRPLSRYGWFPISKS